MNTYKNILLPSFFLSVFLSLNAQHYIPFQGKLFDAEDIPISGTHTFTFIIDDLNWEETHIGVEVFNGIYALVLGSRRDLPSTLFQSTVSHNLDVLVNGAAIDRVVLYKAVETDPTVDESVKDGVSWEEIIDKPGLTNTSGVPISTVLSFAGSPAPELRDNAQDFPDNEIFIYNRWG